MSDRPSPLITHCTTIGGKGIQSYAIGPDRVILDLRLPSGPLTYTLEEALTLHSLLDHALGDAADMVEPADE